MQDQQHSNRLVVELVPHDGLVEPRRLHAPSGPARYWAFALTAFMLALSLYLFLNTSQLIDRVQGRLAGVEDSDARRIRQYNEKLEALQNRMTAFVADSVETKLRSLESNVTAGTVGTQEIKTLEELKGEVQLLQNYSVGKHANLTDPARLDHARFQPVPGSENGATSGDLLYEVTQMKRLLYLGIASCGFAGLMLGGYWWQTSLRTRRLAAAAPRQRLLVARREDG